MTDFDLCSAVATKTGETEHEIRRRGFVLEDPADTGLDRDPDCLFDLIDLPEVGGVDWDEVLSGHSFRQPFYTQTLKARRHKSRAKTSSGKQVARAA